MVFKKDKKGQAAIEFLMTYGWMLLVVLIVGALIFSFVDFGSLLPNKLDLSNSLRGSPGDSVAYSDKGTVPDKNEVRVVFSYVGAKQAQINYNSGTIKNSLSKTCNSYRVDNLDTTAKTGCDSSKTIAGNDCNSAIAGNGVHFGNSGIPFLNGQTGMIYFICNGQSTVNNITKVDTTNIPTVGKLLRNDVLDGRITIKVKNPKTGLEVASAGPIRLSINQ